MIQLHKSYSSTFTYSMKQLFIIFFLSISTAAFAIPANKQNKKTARISPTIINGTATTAPFYVLLDDPSSSGGGMIIADRWILTAGHTTSYAPVYAGIDNRNNITNSSTLQVKDRIKDLYVNTPNPSNDIGLIQLSQPLIFSSTIAPIKLASSANASMWNNGQIGKVYGMGKTSTESYSQQLLTTNVNLLSNSSSVSEKKIYATGPYTNDACNGDSGGPLTNFSVSSDTSARAIGIVSSNLFGNAQFGCGEGGKYTKISDYLRWIIETIHLKSSPSKIFGFKTKEKGYFNRYGTCI